LCYTFEFCCSSAWGQNGLSKCWDAEFTFWRCCAFHPGGGNELFLPALHVEELIVAPSQEGRSVLRLRQNLSDSSWDEKIPGLLFKQSYAMLRWFETLPDTAFEGKNVLELGAGIGLLSIHMASRGGAVVATDGSTRALEIAQTNAKANLPETTFWNLLTWRQVRWQDVQSLEDARAVGLHPPFQLVVCSALMYVPTQLMMHLIKLLWVCTDSSSEVFWGSGIVNQPAAEERWSLLLQCFEVLEQVDAVAQGHTQVEGTVVVRLRRKNASLCH